MNPSWQLFLVLIISLEISFTHRLIANLVLIVIAAIILILQRLHWRTYLRLLFLPAIPAAALAVTIGCFSPGHDWWFAAVLASRVYAYVFLGATVTVTTTPLKLARSLEQNAHLSAKYAYGVLAAVNLTPRTISAIKTIRASARMRGIELHFYSPTLYFKAILQALRWSDQLVLAMESHGFVENQSRTVAEPILVSVSDWLIVVGAIICLQVILIAFP
ncbi:energy-coupling factor transporter transmembrane component T family protein [Limosilactobacillus secaliphilus]|uniref:ABC superfamily ATP binding cassette transporter permease protein n=1 Tax=Limosilactobacillus secaliphilus TaxID=396268 RepID=A0A0R2HZY2_9LACO|nr:energy-coupling factor transporter transmembrane component T [Limosilactobacillus secaliphilus]KRN58432.1 ABC superfamily ATP binding cassette transporter permease protein [Limosilactobacillus secaliphilus]